MSSAAQASALQLSQEDLGLPLNEAVTSSARVRRQRDISMARRLGFDLLQRQQRAIDEYLPTPSLPTNWLDKPFEQYCRDLAELRHVQIHDAPDWAALEPPAGNAWHRCAIWSCCATCFAARWKCGWCWTGPCFSTSAAMTCAWVCFATTLTPRNLLLIAERKEDVPSS